MSDQQTLFGRIGGWFKRGQGSNGDLPLEHSDVEPVASHLIEPRSTFLRPWAKRDAAIDNVQNGIVALGDLMTTIRENLEKQSHRQDELLKYLAHLPEALQSIPENGRVQGETLKAIHQQIEHQTTQQSKLGEILERISRADSENGKSLDALQDRVDSMQQHDQAISQTLNSVGSAMSDVSKSSQTSAQVLSQVRDNMNSRDGELQRLLHRQGSRFTAMLAIAIFLSIAALVAVGIIGYIGYETMQRMH